RSNLLFSLCKYINNNFYGLTEIDDKNIDFFINNNAEAFISHLIKKPIKNVWTIYSFDVCLLKILNNLNNFKIGYKCTII
ncbi:hypothetical protein ACWXVO_01620, partial [Mycoplasma sp. 1890]